MASDLKPCPLCGDDALHKRHYIAQARGLALQTVECSECGLRISRQGDSPLSDLWNSRPTEDTLRARVAELEGEVATGKILREALRRMVRHMEAEARDGDGIREEAWDDYHAALLYLGDVARFDYDEDASARGARDIRIAALPSPKEPGDG